jgi:hypothetical protein
MAEPDEMAVARRRFPLGDHVTGRVTHIPKPGAIGLFVDLGEPPEGFVDVIILPRSPEQWPPVGTVTAFEVIQHRAGQVRLWPVDSSFRDTEHRHYCRTEQQWLAAKTRYPVDARVTAAVTAVYANGECGVSFDDQHGLLEWEGAPPHVGGSADFVVSRHLEAIRVLLLQRPALASL